MFTGLELLAILLQRHNENSAEKNDQQTRKQRTTLPKMKQRKMFFPNHINVLHGIPVGTRCCLNIVYMLRANLV